MKKLLLLIAIFSGSAAAQCVNGTTPIINYVNGQMTTSCRPFGQGTSLPATCTVGQTFFLTSGLVGTYQCTATNTWSVVMGGCTTVSVAYTALTGQTSPYAYSLGVTLTGAGHGVSIVQIWPTTRFTTSGTVTSLTVSLGDGTTATAYSPPVELLANAVSSTNIWSDTGSGITTTGSQALTLTFTSVGGALSTLTAGAFSFCVGVF